MFGGPCLLARLNIVHNREVLEQKLRKTIDQYALCIAVIAQRKWLPVKVLLLNLSQRAAQILITCFVCMSAPTGLSFLSVMAKQAFCMTGSNSVPLPGAVGAYEFLYIGVFGGGLNDSMLMTSMMTARGISYYLCFTLSGVLTWIYHIRTAKR